MANCAFTDYWVKGDTKSLSELFNTMKELEERKESLIENGYGKKWLGNLIAALGGDPMETYCRGQWSDVELYEDHLYFFVESAWREMEETRLFIEKRFPAIKILYHVQATVFGIQTTKQENSAADITLILMKKARFITMI